MYLRTPAPPPPRAPKLYATPAAGARARFGKERRLGKTRHSAAIGVVASRRARFAAVTAEFGHVAAPRASGERGGSDPQLDRVVAEARARRSFARVAAADPCDRVIMRTAVSYARSSNTIRPRNAARARALCPNLVRGRATLHTRPGWVGSPCERWSRRRVRRVHAAFRDSRSAGRHHLRARGSVFRDPEKSCGSYLKFCEDSRRFGCSIRKLIRALGRHGLTS